jgi:hypothetical protein
MVSSVTGIAPPQALTGHSITTFCLIKRLFND